MAKQEIAFIRDTARSGEDLIVKVPRELRDLFDRQRVKVIRIEQPTPPQ